MTERQISSSKVSLIALGGVVLGLVVLAAAVAQTPRASANPATGLVAVEAGGNRVCGITTAGGVECWGGGFGHNAIDVPGLPSSVVSITVGSNFQCALTSGGGVKCWGANGEGQIGNGSSGGTVTTPTDVTGLTSGVTNISAGGQHACAVMTTGTVKCWGDNLAGGVGDSTSGNIRTTPVDVLGLSGVTAVSAGDLHTCALTPTGGVKCWGSNGSGQLGEGPNYAYRTTPVDVAGLSSGVDMIAAGSARTCAVLSGGVKCWGDNSSGLLGVTPNGNVWTPADVSGLSMGVIAVDANSHQCALADTGAVKCWGGNGWGQLGDGSFTNSTVPVNVSALPSDVAAISVGFGSTCAAMSSQGVKCWGHNDWGQLGDGTTTNRNTPVDVLIQKPTPTPTPCPTDGCPTATATRTPTPTPTPPPNPCSGAACPQFSLGIDAQNGTTDDCNANGAATTCVVATGSQFEANIYLNDLGDAGSYLALQGLVTYSGVSPVGGADSVWPGCVLEATGVPPDVNSGCAVGPVEPAVSFTGLIVRAHFTCTNSGTVSLVHGYAETLLIDSATESVWWEDSAPETLDVECVSPVAYPGDSDGDGCPDMKEAQPSPMAGGQRNWLNEYDYFNPTHDHVNRIDDILKVVDQYFIDLGNGGYQTDTDRTLLGPSLWNLGAPDGKQRVDDILNAVNQYFHDCS